MNRKERRAAEAQGRKVVKDEIRKRSDVAADESLVKAQLIQDELQNAVKRALGDDVVVEDVALVINCMGMTAAGLACQIGVGEQEFVDKMSIYIKQVRAALGIDKEEKTEGPSLVLP